jgi:hypothetical protein
MVHAAAALEGGVAWQLRPAGCFLAVIGKHIDSL